jgi:hypothetical protein
MIDKNTPLNCDIQLEIQGIDQYGIPIAEETWILDASPSYLQTLATLATGDELQILGVPGIPDQSATIETRQMMLQYDAHLPGYSKLHVILYIAYGKHMQLRTPPSTP